MADAAPAGAEVVLRICAHAGVRVCFANPGTTEMHIVDALKATPSIRPILCLHENVATGAADGYARMTGRPALVLLHLGPGLANGLANLHNAKRACTPVLVLVGDMATWHQASDAPLCSDIAGLAATVCEAGAVRTPRAPSEVAAEACAALAHTLWPPVLTAANDTPAGPLGTGRVAALVLAHDLSWEACPAGALAPCLRSPPPSPRAPACGAERDGGAESSAPLGARSAPAALAQSVSGQLDGMLGRARTSAGGVPARVVRALLAGARGADAGLEAGGPGDDDSTGAGVAAADPITLSFESSCAAEAAQGCGHSPSAERVERVAAALARLVDGVPAEDGVLGGAAAQQPEAARSGPGPGRVLLLLGGTACADADIVAAAAAVRDVLNAPAAAPSREAVPPAAAAAGRGSEVAVVSSFSRVERGGAHARLQRLPYFPAQAERYLRGFGALVLCGTRAPVAQFGYKDGPSELVPAGASQDGAGTARPPPLVTQLDEADLSGVLRALAAALRAARGVTTPPPPPPPPPPPVVPAGGPLSAAKLCATVAALQPAGAIVVDESLTSGTQYWAESEGCAHAFSHLALTGGAIGSGLPMALGAAVACPERHVLALQADGSGMYSVQALWTMARAQLHNLTVVVCANDAYNILQLEMRMQSPAHARAAEPSARADVAEQARRVDGLMSLSHPPLDWLHLAQGCGVQAERVSTVEALADALRASFAAGADGPRLIEALLVRREGRSSLAAAFVQL